MNDIQGANFSHASYQTKSNPFSLQNGRVLAVSVNKLVGEGMAEVSSSGQKFIAKLDAPLEAGKHYLVRVNQTDDMISLSLVQKIPGERNSKNMAQALIQHLHHQPADKVLLNAVMEFINHKIPVTRELIQFASEQINTVNIKSRLPVLVDMLKGHLPLSEKVLLSLEAGKGQDTFSGLLNSLLDRLTASGSSHDTVNLIKKIQNPLQFHVSKQVAVKALENAMNHSNSFSNRIAHFELLKSLGVVPRDVAFQRMNEGVKNSFSSALIQNNISIEKLLDLMSNMKKMMIQKETRGLQDVNPVMSKLAAELSKGTASDKKSIEQVVKFIFESDVKQLTISKLAEQLIDLMGDGRKQLLERNYMNLLSKWDSGLPTSNEGKIFTMLTADIDAELTFNLRGEDLGQAMKKMLRTFGFNLEAQLHSQPQISASNTLKEKLTQLFLHHPGAEIRDLAERLVMKMNHPALISWEQSSMMNIVQQFPLYLFGHHTDITVQWMGKEKEKGKIDSDHCRILFYLQLDRLKETLVDMHVQNRVISLSIWNEQESVNEYAQSLTPALKESLQRMDYQLSSVKVKKPDYQNNIQQIRDQEMQNRSYTGVDLKI